MLTLNTSDTFDRTKYLTMLIYWWTLGGHVFILLTELCFAVQQKNLFTTGVSLNGLTCSGDDVLFTKQPVSRVECSVLCENNNHCTGFAHRLSGETCVGCKDGPTRISSPAPGMFYYEPANRKWGLPCTFHYACTGDNQQCMNGLCVCVPGYSFNSTSWTCVASCERYGDTFQMYPGHSISGHNVEVLLMPLGQCLQACRERASCRSVDYSEAFQLVCNIQNVTPLEVPDEFYEHDMFDFYNRNC